MDCSNSSVPAGSSPGSTLLMFKAEHALSTSLKSSQAARLLSTTAKPTATGQSENKGGVKAGVLGSTKPGRQSGPLSSQAKTGTRLGAPQRNSSEDGAAAEVRALGSLQANQVAPNGEGSTRQMVGVHAMLERKKAKHEATWANYIAARESLERQCENMIAQAVENFKLDAQDEEQEVSTTLDPMAGGQLGALSLDDLQRIWAAAATLFPGREALIERLGVALEGVEQRRVAEAHRHLAATTERLMDIAHLTRGPIERLVEEESLDLNRTVLANRQAHADLLARLQTREVDQQASWREEWEANVERWRLLRMRHTVDAFRARMGSAEFADPPERNAELGDAREGEERHVSALHSQVASLRVLLPPAAFGVDSVDRWQAQVQSSLDSWQEDLQCHLDKLRALEEELGARADAAYEQIVQEVKGYEAMSEEAAVAQLEREAKPLMEERHAAAAAVLHGVKGFLCAQAEKRAKSAAVLTGYVKRVVAEFDAHKANEERLQSGIRESLARGRAAFEDEDRERQGAFEELCGRIREGADEADLDAKVAAALHALAGIEEGYRVYHAGMTGKVEAHPGALEELESAHRTGFEQLLGLGDMQTGVGEVTQNAGDEKSNEVGPGSTNATSPASMLHELLYAEKDAAKTVSKQGEAGTESAQKAEPTASEPEVRKKSVGARSDGLKRSGSSKEVVRKGGDTRGRSGGEKGSANGSPVPTVTPVPEAAVADVSGAGGSGPTGADAPGISTLELVGDICPVAADGTPYFGTHLLSREFYVEILADLQGALAAELARSAAALKADAAAFCKAQLEHLTTELDARLRKHRPRAGRVEEELRSKRSAELQKQRQTFLRHMRAMAQQAKEDQAAFDERLDAAGKKMAAATEKLTELEEALEDLPNLPGVQVKIREAEHMRRVVHGIIDRTVEDLESAARSTCEDFKEQNQRFAAESFQRLSDGGTWIPEAIADCERQLKEADAAADVAEGQNFDRVAEARREGEQELADAHDSFTEMVAPHKEDLALLELAEAAFSSTKSRFADLLETSTAAATAVQDALAALSALLSNHNPAQFPNPVLAKSAAAAGAGSNAQNLAVLTTESSEEPVRRPPVLVVKVFEQLDRVRKLMVSRAHLLQCLKSEVPRGEIPLSLDESPKRSPPEGSETPLAEPPQKASGGKERGKASPEPAKKGARKESGKASPAGTKKRASKEAEQPEAEELDTSTLAGQIKKLTGECRAKLGAACEAYYEGLGDREPTRGARILEDAAAMAELHERTLSQIEWEGQEHREQAVTRLRAQVITLTGLLAQLPTVVFDDLGATEVVISEESRAHADSAFAARLGELAAARAAHKLALRPGAARPAMAAAFDELKDKEAARAQSAQAAIAEGSRGAAAVLDSDGRAFRTRLVRCTDVLLALYDGMLLPEDLEPPTSDGDEIMAMQRKSLKQLLREQRHVQQNPASASAALAAAPSARPYSKRTWPGVRSDELDLKQLGWKEKEPASAEKVPAEVSFAEGKRPAEKPAASGAKSAGVLASGETGKGKGGKPPAKTAGDAAGKAGAGRKEGSGTPEVTEEGVGADVLARPAEGLDTPFHHAIVRARDHALENYAAHVTRAAERYCQQLEALRADESDWAGFWSQQCRECQLAMR